MPLDSEIAQWLQEQPLDEPVDIDGESVYLRVHPDGAELGAYLIHAYSPAQLKHALSSAFQSVRQFDAGLGRSTDGNSLVLNQWLPEVSTWTGAAEALEQMLNQVALWRALLAPNDLEMDKTASRNEQRLRMMFRGSE